MSEQNLPKIWHILINQAHFHKFAVHLALLASKIISVEQIY